MGMDDESPPSNNWPSKWPLLVANVMSLISGGPVGLPLGCGGRGQWLSPTAAALLSHLSLLLRAFCS